MAQEEKELLLKDLCARLPYGVSCYYETSDESETMFGKLTFRAIESFATNKPLVSEKDNNMVYFYKVISIKPYLRPMSSMTNTEREEYGLALCDELSINEFDYLNSIHIDYRGLIEKGLALEAPEGMYNIKENKL